MIESTMKCTKSRRRMHTHPARMYICIRNSFWHQLHKGHDGCRRWVGGWFERGGDTFGVAMASKSKATFAGSGWRAEQKSVGKIFCHVISGISNWKLKTGNCCNGHGHHGATTTTATASATSSCTTNSCTTTAPPPPSSSYSQTRSNAFLCRRQMWLQ